MSYELFTSIDYLVLHGSTFTTSKQISISYGRDINTNGFKYSSQTRGKRNTRYFLSLWHATQSAQMHKLSNLLLIDKVLQQMGLWSSATPLFVRRVSVWHMGVVEQATVLFDEGDACFAWRRRGYLLRKIISMAGDADEFKDHIRSEVPLQLKNTNQQTPYTPHFYSTTRSLQALRVPIILDLASGARNAGCRASPTLTTTLTPVGSSTTARARRSSRSSRSSSLRSLDHSRQGSSRLGSNSSSRSANRNLGRNSRSGRLGRCSSGGSCGCGIASATADDGRTGCLVRSVDGGVVDVGKDTGVGLVELGAALCGSRVECEQLNAHEVLARSNAAGHGELLPTEAVGVGVADHVVDTPDTR
ncbi:hypothetical protein KCU84_g14, partial [Aureobasidium melanogenum]